jgi:hypothetical protein
MATPHEQAETQRLALAAFDRAYEAFLRAFAQVPDKALSYLPPGDEYALGVLPIHLIHPIQRYMAVLDRIEAVGFGSVDLSATPAYEAKQAQQHSELVAHRPTPAERAALLADLDAAHRAGRQRLAALDPVTFERAAPVIYTAGSDPYPTSAHAISGWLADHYDEHTTQTQQMLAQWRASGA